MDVSGVEVDEKCGEMMEVGQSRGHMNLKLRQGRSRDALAEKQSLRPQNGVLITPRLI